MTKSISDFYRGPTVWVEDQMTREILTRLWGNCGLEVMVAHGSESVRALVAAAPISSRHLVHGLVDRDFGELDMSPNRWLETDGRIFVLPVHEAENLLLDFAALASLARDCTEQQLRDAGQWRAEQLVWWMGCRAVLRMVSNGLTKDFPKDPSVDGPNGVVDRASARRFVGRLPFAWRVGELLQQRSPAALERAVEEKSELYQQQVRDGNWLKTFSGKEVLRHLRANTPGLDGPTSKRETTVADRDLDLAKRLLRSLFDSQKSIDVVDQLKEELLRPTRRRG